VYFNKEADNTLMHSSPEIAAVLPD